MLNENNLITQLEEMQKNYTPYTKVFAVLEFIKKDKGVLDTILDNQDFIFNNDLKNVVETYAQDYGKRIDLKDHLDIDFQRRIIRKAYQNQRDLQMDIPLREPYAVPVPEKKGLFGFLRL